MKITFDEWYARSDSFKEYPMKFDTKGGSGPKSAIKAGLREGWNACLKEMEEKVCRERPPEKPLEAILGHPEAKMNKDMGNEEEGFETAYIEPDEHFCLGQSDDMECRICCGTREDYEKCSKVDL